MSLILPQLTVVSVIKGFRVVAMGIGSQETSADLTDPFTDSHYGQENF